MEPDVRVAEGGESARLALEAERRVASALTWAGSTLDRDRALEARVVRLVDLAATSPPFPAAETIIVGPESRPRTRKVMSSGSCLSASAAGQGYDGRVRSGTSPISLSALAWLEKATPVRVLAAGGPPARSRALRSRCAWQRALVPRFMGLQGVYEPGDAGSGVPGLTAIDTDIATGRWNGAGASSVRRRSTSRGRGTSTVEAAGEYTF